MAPAQEEATQPEEKPAAAAVAVVESAKIETPEQKKEDKPAVAEAKKPEAPSS